MTQNSKGTRAGWLVRASALAIVAATATPVAALAQDQDDTIVEELIVTSTRRAENVQDVPLNIAAIGAATIEEQGLSDLSELAQWVPGIYIGDVGSRGSSRIVVRGLNASPLAAAESLNNDGGGTVATYLGEIPLYVDLKLNDMDRVEFLLGPQGTLYGAGTLGGAVRYIPTKPKLGRMGFSYRSEHYDYSEGSDLSHSYGGTLNFPIGEQFAIRANLDWLDDAGFIDYNYVVRDPGVSEPDPDFSDPADVAANMRRVPDANTEEALSGRIAARWVPDWGDLTLTYYYQNVDSGGRQVSQHRVTTFPVDVPEYSSLSRVLEPSESKNTLLSLEGIFDLGFAELTSATGFSTYEEHGGRDQTDFLIALEYSYEAFPTFTAFTREDQEIETFTQELRLVSKGEGPLSWIAGAFYNRQDDDNSSREFTPHIDAFFGGSRPDGLEYIAVGRTKLEEMAAYGEVTYEFTERFRATLGGRYFNYELDTQSATDLPLLQTVFGGRTPVDLIELNFTGDQQKDNGFLYKVGASYDFSDDVMGYATISQGYRIGGFNGLDLCTGPNTQQSVCAQPDELFYEPDKTTNYEIGIKSVLYDGRLTLNADVYYIDWEDVQLDGTSVVGAAPIDKNGEGAKSTGFEVSFNALLTDNFSIRGSFSYNQAELTARAPDLISQINPPGFGQSFIDGEDGDRLPGSPETQASLFASYDIPGAFRGWDLSLDAGMYYVGDRFTRTANKGGGIVLPAYTITNVSATLKGEQWRATLFVDNLFDELAETGVRVTPRYNQVLTDADGGDVYARYHFTYVLPPRTIGIRFSRDFGDE